MKNITEILKDVGAEVLEDKQSELNRALSENYKTVAEFDKKLRKSDEERDAWRERAEAAEKTQTKNRRVTAVFKLETVGLEPTTSRM